MDSTADDDGSSPRNRYRELLSIVSDLSLVPSLDILESRLVSRARILIGADLAFLWELDSKSETFSLAKTSGGHTAALSDLRIEAGRGMAGSIFNSGIPLSSSDYSRDNAFVHDERLDEAMADEGIRTAVGVPVDLGGDRRGVIVGASRRPLPFDFEDADLLHTLCQHATIAITRIARSEADSTRIERLNEQAAELSFQTQMSDRIHSTVANVALTGGSIDELVRDVAKILSSRLAIFDAVGTTTIAQAGGFSVSDRVVDLVTTAAAERVPQHDDHYAAVPIITASGLHGVLCLETGSDGRITDSDVRIVERIAVTAAMLLLLIEAAAGAEGYRRDAFIDDLLSGFETDGRLAHRASQLRMDIHSPYTLHIVESRETSAHRLAQFAHDAAVLHNGIAGRCLRASSDNAPTVVALMPGSDAAANVRKLRRSLDRVSRSRVSVSGAGPVQRGTAAAEVFEEAVACSTALRRIKGDDACGTMMDLGFIGLVLGTDSTAARFVSDTIGKLKEYDADHGTELLDTLKALLSSDGSPTAAARQMYVHVNTIRQRLKRLEDFIGEDWRSAERSAELWLAIRMDQMRS